jgi:branched-chain amino acid transport system permease protein
MNSSIDLVTVAQLLINGALLGGLYALIAFGLSVVYGVAKILNFAHGTMLAIAAISGSVLSEKFGLPIPAILIILVVSGFLFGWIFHLTLLQPLEKRESHHRTVGMVLVTVGALIIMGDVTAVLAGAQQRVIRLTPTFFEVYGVIISGTQIGILIGAAICMIALHIFLTRSWTGSSIRAVAQNTFGATICGIDSTRTSATTFALGAGIVAVAGLMYIISYPLNPYSGFPLTVKAFSIILLGGIGNLTGTLLAGLALGVGEAVVAYTVGPQWAAAVSILIVLGCLLLFPGLTKSRRAA